MNPATLIKLLEQCQLDAEIKTEACGCCWMTARAIKVVTADPNTPGVSDCIVICGKNKTPDALPQSRNDGYIWPEDEA